MLVIIIPSIDKMTVFKKINMYVFVHICRHTPWRGVWIEIIPTDAPPPPNQVTPRGGVCGLKFGCGCNRTG